MCSVHFEIQTFGDHVLAITTLPYNEVPEQWLVSKTVPVFKNKGDTKDIKN